MFPSVEKQRILIVALRDSEVFLHFGDNWQLIKTHNLWVILCSADAYKIKKALDLGFDDDTALERRKFYCDEELRLNSRLAPEFYLRILPIAGNPPHPQLRTKEGAFAYAAKMNWFPTHGLLCEPVDDRQLKVKASGLARSSTIKQSLMTLRETGML